MNSRQRASGILKKNVPLLHELDKKYKGVVSSRKDLELESESLSDEEEGDDDDVEAEDTEDSDDVDDSEEEEDEDNDLGIGDFINQFKSKVQKDVQSADSDEDNGEANSEDDDEADDSDAEDMDSEENEDSDDEEEDVNDVEDEDEEMDDSAEDDDESDAASASMKILQPAQENTVQKGQAVRTQLDLWERILETRIKIQPVLNKSNGLPDAETFCHFQEASEEFSSLAKDTQKNVASLLDNLIDLQNSMMQQFSETKAILKSGLYKRKFVAEQEKGSRAKKLCLDNQDGGGAEGVFKTYRNSVIQKWSDRTKVTNARNSKELMLNHNIISQIEGVLLNKPDLIKNSQTVKGTYELFGKAAKEDGGDGDQKTKEEEDKELSKWSPEIYDDTDFYHQMLRELIEYKSNSSTNPVEAARNYSELQKLRTKIKKQVDQKASKGRKIRYVVHKKIVSYMAPYSDSHWTQEATQELFSSLFGNYEKSLNDKNSAQVEEDAEDNEVDMKIL